MLTKARPELRVTNSSILGWASPALRLQAQSRAIQLFPLAAFSPLLHVVLDRLLFAIP